MFLKFESSSEREAFFQKLREKRPDIEAHCRASKSQPEIVTLQALTLEQAKSVKELVGKVKIYEDVRFETLSPD